MQNLSKMRSNFGGLGGTHPPKTYLSTPPPLPSTATGAMDSLINFLYFSTMLLQNSLHIKPLPVVTNWNSPYNTNFLNAEKKQDRNLQMSGFTILGI